MFVCAWLVELCFDLDLTRLSIVSIDRFSPSFFLCVSTKISTISLTVKYILVYFIFYTKLEIVLRTYIGYILKQWFKFTTKGQGKVGR